MQQFNPQALRAKREAAGKSREETSVAVHRSFASISAYERRLATPPPDVLCRLAEFYGCDVSDFFTNAAERLVAQAEAQGFDRNITDPSIIGRAATLIQGDDAA